MPNWCNNTVEIYHEDSSMIERVREGFNGDGLFGALIPVPESLHIVAGYLGDGEEQRKLEEDTARNIATHGYGNWYDYCVNEWGTKWDVNGDGYPAQDIPGGLMLSFDSAWAPPIAAYDKLEAMGFTIRAMYYEPGMCFAGIYEDGHDDCYDFSNMSSTEVADELPVELDEAFGISECMAEYEEENLEIDLDGGLSATNEQEQK